MLQHVRMSLAGKGFITSSLVNTVWKRALNNKFCVLFSSYKVLCLFSLMPNRLIPWGAKEDTQNLFLCMASPFQRYGHQTGFWGVWEQQPREGWLERKVGAGVPAQPSPVLFNESLPRWKGCYPPPPPSWCLTCTSWETPAEWWTCWGSRGEHTTENN